MFFLILNSQGRWNWPAQPAYGLVLIFGIEVLFTKLKVKDLYIKCFERYNHFATLWWTGLEKKSF